MGHCSSAHGLGIAKFFKKYFSRYKDSKYEETNFFKFFVKKCNLYKKFKRKVDFTTSMNCRHSIL